MKRLVCCNDCFHSVKNKKIKLRFVWVDQFRFNSHLNRFFWSVPVLTNGSDKKCSIAVVLLNPSMIEWEPWFIDVNEVYWNAWFFPVFFSFCWNFCCHSWFLKVKAFLLVRIFQGLAASIPSLVRPFKWSWIFSCQVSSDAGQIQCGLPYFVKFEPLNFAAISSKGSPLAKFVSFFSILAVLRIKSRWFC